MLHHGRGFTNHLKAVSEQLRMRSRPIEEAKSAPAASRQLSMSIFLVVFKEVILHCLHAAAWARVDRSPKIGRRTAPYAF
jgi:hypothetical protein